MPEPTLYRLLLDHRTSIIARAAELLSGDAQLKLVATLRELTPHEHIAALADLWLEALMTDLKLGLDSAFRLLLGQSLQFNQGHQLPFTPPLYHKLFEALLISVRVAAGGGAPGEVEPWAESVRRSLEEVIGIG